MRRKNNLGGDVWGLKCLAQWWTRKTSISLSCFFKVDPADWSCLVCPGSGSSSVTLQNDDVAEASLFEQSVILLCFFFKCCLAYVPKI